MGTALLQRRMVIFFSLTPGDLPSRHYLLCGRPQSGVSSRASRETLFVSRAVQLSKFIGRMACAFRRPWFSSARWPCRGVFPLVFFFYVSRLSGKDIISQIETMLVIFYQILGIAKVGIPIFSVVLRNNILPLRRSSLLLITDTPVWQS